MTSRLPDFWGRVSKDGLIPAHAPALGQCWPWTGPADRKGYGRHGRDVASRYSWSLANGPIPDGLWVLHHCDNPPCVNPGHLYLGTVVENVRDAVERGRVHRPRKDHCTNGHLKEGANLRVIVQESHTSYLCRKCDNERSNERQKADRQARGLLKARLSDEERAAIVAMRQDGVTYRKIAMNAGRSLMAVHAVIKEAGLCR